MGTAAAWAGTKLVGNFHCEASRPVAPTSHSDRQFLDSVGVTGMKKLNLPLPNRCKIAFLTFSEASLSASRRHHLGLQLGYLLLSGI